MFRYCFKLLIVVTGVPFPKSVKIFDYHSTEIAQKLSGNTMFCSRHREKKLIGFHGFLGKSVMIIDLDLIKQMLIKDFDFFIDKPIFDLGNKYLNSILTQGMIY